MKIYFDQTKTEEKVNERVRVLLLSVACFLIASFLYTSSSSRITLDRIVSIGTLTIKEKPSIRKHRGRKKMIFVFSELKKPLELSSIDLECVKDMALLENLNQGDKVEVWVDKDFNENYSLTRECIYGLVVGKQNLCDLDCRNQKFAENQNAGVVAFCSLAIGCFISLLLPSNLKLDIPKRRSQTIDRMVIGFMISFILMYLYYLLIF